MAEETVSHISDERSEQMPSSKDTRNKSIKAAITKIGLDMIPVIMGILIALFINNAQQNSKDRRFLETTLKSLSEEFKENEVEVRKKLPLHQRLLDTLQKYREHTNYSIYDILIKEVPLALPNLFTTHWQATLNNNSLGFLNFKTIKILSEIDAQHQEMRKQEDVLFPIVFGPAMYKQGEAGKEYRQALEGWLISFKANEEKLLTLYKKFESTVHSKQSD